MPVFLLDESLKVDVYFDPDDTNFEDDICVCFSESCKEDEKIFKVEESHIYITPQQARQLAEALLKAAEQSDYSDKNH
jgi:hypothetical protein